MGSDRLDEVDRQLAERYGAYASYVGASDPVAVETFGDDPADEMDRLLDSLVKPDSCVLDLGCGAGFTLCRLAPSVKAIWGFDEEAELLDAARLRVEALGLTNVTLVHGNVAKAEDIARLPNDTFDVVFSRRGPDVNASLMPKLKPDGLVAQELYQSPLGLREIFGRESFLAKVSDNPHWVVSNYSWLGLFPVSIKEYYYESYFSDADHLSAYLLGESMLSGWPMPPLPYSPERDSPALELYVRYNQTPKGIRLVNHRKVFLFRRTPVQHYPAAPELKPRYAP